MITPRYAHTATLLLDGRVLVAGGAVDAETYLEAAEIYDPETGTWSATGNLTTPRREHKAVLLPDGRVLVSGGSNDGVKLGSTELYDPETGRWSLSSSVLRRVNHSLTLLSNGNVLMVGGLNESFYVLDAEIYNVFMERWIHTRRSQLPRSSSPAVKLRDGRVLVIAGDGTVGSSEFYDPATRAWSFSNNNLFTNRGALTGTLLPSGEVLAAGGWSAEQVFPFVGETVDTAELYDPDTDLWALTSAMLVARQGHSATLLPEGKVLVLGGRNEGIGIHQTAELFDPMTATWSFTGDLSSPRWAHSSTLLNDGRVLVAGGRKTTFSAELYDSAIANPFPWPTVHANMQRTAHVDVDAVLGPVERFHLIIDDSPESSAAGLSALSSPTAFPDGVRRLYRLDRNEAIDMNTLQVINTETAKIEHTLDDLNAGVLWTQPTILKNGKVVVADHNRISLYTPDLKTRFWSRELYDLETPDPPKVASPVTALPVYGAEELGDGNLMVPTGGGTIFIIEPRFGHILSTFDITTLGTQPDPRNSDLYLGVSPAFDGNLVFLLVYEEVLMLEYRSGEGLFFKQRFTYGDGQLSTTAPTLDSSGKRLFFASFPIQSSATLAALHAFNYGNETLSRRWAYDGPEVQPVLKQGDQVSATYNPHTGVIIFNNVRGKSTAFREVSCETGFCPVVAWQTPHEGSYLTAIAANDNVLYSVDRDNALFFALDGDTGAIIWEFPVPDTERLNLKPALIADSIIYYDYPHGVYAIGQEPGP